jgi:hypothetical protein
MEKRLIPGASFANESPDWPTVQACLAGGIPEPEAVADYAGVWERTAERYHLFGDPEETLRLLEHVDSSRTSGNR